MSNTGRTVTLRDIAEFCGVSRITVSYALRGDRKNVSQATIERVTAAAQVLGYDPAMAHAARRLRYQQSDQPVINSLVALFFPYGAVHSRYWATIFEGLHRGFHAKRIGVLSCELDCKAGGISDQLPYLFKRGDVDGVTMFATEQYRTDFIEALRADPGFGMRPIVSITEPFAGCSAALIDDYRVGYLAASHLLELGHRHLLAFRNERYIGYIMQQRIAGYRHAFLERGIVPEGHLHFSDWIWEPSKDLGALMHAVLRQFPHVTGILSPSDGYGVQTARWLRRQGYRIPEDISLIGADDCEELLDHHGDNIWTTIRLPLYDLGLQAAQLLIDRVNGTVPGDTTISFPVTLVERGSTAPPARRTT